MSAPLTKKDFVSDQEVRWCPGCGDYGILLAVQQLMPELGVAPENTVFISGIGCSSPGVPGTTHARASVCSSRRYGK